MSIVESIFIDADISDDSDDCTLVVYKQCGSGAKMVNAFTGDEALRVYKLLMGQLWNMR